MLAIVQTPAEAFPVKVLVPRPDDGRAEGQQAVLDVLAREPKLRLSVPGKPNRREEPVLVALDHGILGVCRRLLRDRLATGVHGGEAVFALSLRIGDNGGRLTRLRDSLGSVAQRKTFRQVGKLHLRQRGQRIRGESIAGELTRRPRVREKGRGERLADGVLETPARVILTIFLVVACIIEMM